RDRPGGHPRVVLVGPPNAGKSRLFNALAGAAKALVSPRAGTTRDYLSAVCDCDGLTVELIDTAGVEEQASGAIEGRAQALRDEQAAGADLLLVCRSCDTGPNEDDGQSVASGQPRLLVATKSDLGPPDPTSGHLATSAQTGQGLAELR